MSTLFVSVPSNSFLDLSVGSIKLCAPYLHPIFNRKNGASENAPNPFSYHAALADFKYSGSSRERIPSKDGPQ